MQMEIDLVDEDDSVILVTGEEHRLEGNEHYRKLDYKAALECYSAAISTEPNVALFYSNRSAANLMLLKYHDALKDAQKACDLDINNVKQLIRLCKCNIILGRFDAAKKLIDQVLVLDNNNSDIKTQIGDLAKCKDSYEQYQSQNQKEDFRHALHCIENCLKIAQASSEMKLVKVDLFIKLKRYIEAKDLLEKQLIDNKDCDSQITTESLFYRGLCLYYMEHIDKAETHFKHVLKLNPDHINALKAHKRCKRLSHLKDEGNKLVRNSQFEKARLTYSEALEVDPAHDALNAKLYFNRALTLLKVARFQEAMNDCDKALLLDPSYVKVFTRRVQCLMGLERWEDAVKEAKRLQRAHPSDEAARVLREAQTGLKRSQTIDLYKVLGVARTADEAELKRGYRKRALLHHPDRHSNADESTRKAEEVKFKEVNTAYSVLSDARKRQMYDAGADLDQVLGNNGGGGCHGNNQNYHKDVFQTFFKNGGGGGCHGPQKFSFNFQ